MKIPRNAADVHVAVVCSDMTAGRARKTARRACLLLIAVSAKDLLAVRTEITEGNPTSPVKVVIYDDLQCSDCQNFRTMLDQKILPRYGDKVAFVHRDFPLGKHYWARKGPSPRGGCTNTTRRWESRFAGNFCLSRTTSRRRI